MILNLFNIYLRNLVINLSLRTWVLSTIFLGIFVKYFDEGIFLNQLKYVKDLLCKVEMSNYALMSTPTNVKKKFKPRDLWMLQSTVVL